MRRTSLTALVAIGILIWGVLTGCTSFAALDGDPGPTRTEERTIPDASAVELATGGDLTLTTGDAPSLRITAGADVIGHLTSEVSGDRLVLGADQSLGRVGEIRY